MSELEEAYKELTDIFWDVYMEYGLAPKGGWDEFYLQGKKDGLRTALALLSPLVTEDLYWGNQLEMSTKGRGTKLQHALALLKYAYDAANDWVEFPGKNSLDRENWQLWVKVSGLIKGLEDD